MKNFYRDGGLVIAVIALAAAVLFLSGYVYFKSTSFFWVIAPFVVLIAGFAIGKLIQVTRKTFQYFARIDEELDVANHVSFNEFPLAVAIIDTNRQFVWFNQNFRNEFENESAYGCSLDLITKQTVKNMMKDGGTEITYKGRYYNVYASLPMEENVSDIIVVYFRNVTKMRTLEIEQKLSHPVAVIVMIDSYEEMFSGTAESEKAKITAQIDELLENFIAKTNGVMWKVNRDKFHAVIEERHVAQIISEKVKILDKAREITVTDRMNITLSIGIGRTAKSLAESEIFARQALDMANERGGDQAAIKTANGFEFYGGVSEAKERRQSSVKTRIIAKSIMELATGASDVYIMGHRESDFDCLGASIGLACAIRRLGRNAYVVVNIPTSLGKPLINYIKPTFEEKNQLFITTQKAREQFGEDSLLIITDTHTPQNLEDSELYEKAGSVVVIDHHRKMVGHIDNAAIFHLEPSASSASEMVTEMLRYFGDAGKITAKQAEALLAGIMLDTKNFTVKTNVRTFEAAAFLRKIGADTMNAKVLFANSMESNRNKAAIVASAKTYNDCVISFSDTVVPDMRIIASQAADEMLETPGINASFVLYRISDNEISISARSSGSYNVQVIMETLGGGGHQTMAGAQLKDCSMLEAEKKLTSAIESYFENNTERK